MARPRKLNAKQEETIERMKQTRIDDGIRLRKTIEEKLQWAIEEKKKGLAVIEKQMQQIKENQLTMQKLTAVIDILTDLLREKETTESSKE